VVAVPHRSFLRDAGLIAGFDLRESLRTRRAVVLVLLYLLIATAASGIYVQAVRAIEDTIQAAAGADADAAMAVARDDGYRGVLLFVAGGDAALADQLATYPAMVLIFAWTSLAFLPWFIALTSYDQIAGDLHLRTIRYAALRTSRAAYVAGKLAAQAVLVAGVAALGMLPVIIIGAIYLQSFDLVATVTSLLATWPITLLYALAVLGIVSFASQLCRGPGAARAVAIGLLLLIQLMSLDFFAGGLFAPISPWTWKSGLFHPDLATRGLSVAACLGLCLGYTALGYLRFRKRDL
jgi:ABC-type transport system involved in multi-copper enzyme maturation permease subunit